MGKLWCDAKFGDEFLDEVVEDGEWRGFGVVDLDVEVGRSEIEVKIALEFGLERGIGMVGKRTH